MFHITLYYHTYIYDIICPVHVPIVLQPLDLHKDLEQELLNSTCTNFLPGTKPLVRKFLAWGGGGHDCHLAVSMSIPYNHDVSRQGQVTRQRRGLINIV